METRRHAAGQSSAKWFRHSAGRIPVEGPCLYPAAQEGIEFPFSIKNTTGDSGPKNPRQYQSHAQTLGNNKKTLDDAFEARAQLHRQWRKFIDEAVGRGEKCTADFACQRAETVAKINEAKEELAVNKVAFDNTKKNFDEGENQDGRLTSSPRKGGRERTSRAQAEDGEDRALSNKRCRHQFRTRTSTWETIW